MRGRPTVGVLALQGDVREHLASLTESGADAVPVLRVDELDRVDGLVLPGGESTTMSRLLQVFDLLEPLRTRLKAGLPAFGSCAGMIMLACEVLDTRPDAEHLNAIDITVRRNAFGRQVDSFETNLEVHGIGGGPLPAVFIRAPWVEQAGPDVEILAEVAMPGDSRQQRCIVAVRQDAVFATAFHPELTRDRRLHRLFVEAVRSSG
jgi:pyridoxal 5'-phosphate synthase pdxT subunit